MSLFRERRVEGVCPVCRREELRSYRRPKQTSQPSHFSITKASYGATRALACCCHCGIVFVHPFPPSEAVKPLYERMEDPEYLKEERERRAMAERGLAFIGKYQQKGCLLDVGCFTGFLLDEAQKRGWKVMGIEPSRWAGRIAEETFHLNVVGGTLEEASLPEASFEVVTLVDALEHLQNPRETLLETRRILKEEGVLYLTTPDVESLVARLLRNRWWGFRPEHLIYFSRRSLSHLLTNVGFSILAQRSFQRTFTIESVLRRLKEVSPFFSRVLRPVGALPGVGPLRISVNFFDQIELIARKGEP
ncbi:MAG: class I SAM-dependent methyltransferase [Candidatus Omnitrophica bacterium]|nr:class I SAM-dependent methyltransferase [Candidatus Omnitrophota bacterium]